MIRDFFMEMWFRDRQSPTAFLIQIGCIFMALFGGIINSGFPYTCLYAYIAFTIKLEIFNPTAVPQMNYLIPCKESQIKKERMVKSTVLAFLFSGLNVFGYCITITFVPKYQWDMESVMLIIVMFIIFFGAFGTYSIQTMNNSYIDYASDRNNWKISVVIRSAIALIMGFSSIGIWLYCKFSGQNIPWILYWAKGSMFGIVFVAVAIILVFQNWIYHSKRISVGDFHD